MDAATHILHVVKYVKSFYMNPVLSIQVLEELGVLSSIKRLAGTSVGSIIAAFLGVGCTPQELKKIIYENNLSDLIYGITHTFSYMIPHPKGTQYGIKPVLTLNCCTI